jgi:NAD(P)-dependent dehydrogenase (short-subunit alcohol dehydrogenase family)
MLRMLGPVAKHVVQTRPARNDQSHDRRVARVRFAAPAKYTGFIVSEPGFTEMTFTSGSVGWSLRDIPSQAGRLSVVTGVGGLGYETALALARAGGHVILAGRNPTRGNASLTAIKTQFPAATVQFEILDLASLHSVASFADRVAAQHDRLDLLVNNAGIMTPPERKLTADGFELQFGTNYLGHFALTGRLLSLLCHGHDARVVSLSSVAHRGGKIHFDDLQWTHGYKSWPAYQQSKLAMLMFALELQRRSDSNGWQLKSMAAHPGFARTELIANGPAASSWFSRLGRLMAPLISQSPAEGALPTLFDATAPDAANGAYYGPTGFQEMKGPPGLAQIKPQAQDEAVAARLWQVSEQLTGRHFEG